MASSVDRSGLADRAYREYCRRLKAGDALDPDAYCAQFPAVKSSLSRIILLHRFLEEDLALVGEGEAVEDVEESPPPR